MIHRGYVVSRSDPEGRGRLRVRVPSVLKTLAVWAEPCFIATGSVSVGDHGSHKHDIVLPRSGSIVWVMFENGDKTKPVWLGVL